MAKVRAQAGGDEETGDRVQIGPRVSKELVERLKQLAARNGRSFNRELEKAVEDYLAQEESALPEEIIAAVEAYWKRQQQQ